MHIFKVSRHSTHSFWLFPRVEKQQSQLRSLQEARDAEKKLFVYTSDGFCMIHRNPFNRNPNGLFVGVRIHRKRVETMRADMEKTQRQSISLVERLREELLTAQTEKSRIQEAFDRLKQSSTSPFCRNKHAK